MKTFHTKVVGVTFEGRQRVVSRLKINDQLEFVPDPYNPYDDHAVKVMTKGGEQVGFISKEQNRQIFENLVCGRGKYIVTVSTVTGGGFDTNYGCNILVEFQENEYSVIKRTVEEPFSIEVGDILEHDFRGRGQVVSTNDNEFILRMQDGHLSTFYRNPDTYKRFTKVE